MPNKPSPASLSRRVDPLMHAIDRRRIELRMTQNGLADRASSTQATVSDALTGAHSPTLYTLRKIADALGCDLALVAREVPDGR